MARQRVSASARQLVTPALAAARESLGSELAARLHALPERAELDGMLICHGSRLSDIDSFAPQPQLDEQRLLAGEGQRTILFGHSHQQFRRAGPNETALVNPGSVGAPLDGDPRAAWALYDKGEIASAEPITTSSGPRHRCAQTPSRPSAEQPADCDSLERAGS